MTYNITETVDTVAWKDGEANAPADLVTAARKLSEEGKPATFGKSKGTGGWVVLSVNDRNELYIAIRS